MFQEVLNATMPHIVSIVTVLVGALATFITYKVNLYLQKVKLKSDNELTSTIIDKTVAYVDQKLSDKTNEEKFQIAAQKAAEWLKSKNITVSETELEIMIEAAVNGAHKGLNQPLEMGIGQLEIPEIQEVKEECTMEENKENEVVLEEATELNEPEVTTEEETVVEVIETEEPIVEVTEDVTEQDEINVENPDLDSDGIDEETANEKLEEGQG